MAKVNSFFIEDGILPWFQGPEWSDVVEEAFKSHEDQVKAYAKANAPWEDQTGDARAGLNTKVSNNNGEVTLSLFHTVSYGKWLETIQSGNFAIIQRTLETHAREIFADATRRVKAARKGD